MKKNKNRDLVKSKIKLIRDFLNMFYPEFDSKVRKFDRKNSGYDEIVYFDEKKNKILAIYHYNEKILQLDPSLYKDLKNVFDEEMIVYVVDWFNDEFNQDAEAVGF